jgi:hypothetical protein
VRLDECRAPEQDTENWHKDTLNSSRKKNRNFVDRHHEEIDSDAFVTCVCERSRPCGCEIVVKASVDDVLIVQLPMDCLLYTS